MWWILCKIYIYLYICVVGDFDCKMMIRRLGMHKCCVVMLGLCFGVVGVEIGWCI